MAENKTMLARQTSQIFLLSRDGSAASLRLQLQKEIDQLALLIEEVKKQSDRVQATADAIADRILSQAPRQYPKSRRMTAIKGASNSDLRPSKSPSENVSPV